jgi:cytochrome c peroxidase
MHDGSLKTLEEVVDLYDEGGRANPNLDPDIQPLRVNDADKRALVAFLKTLTGARASTGGLPR